MSVRNAMIKSLRERIKLAKEAITVHQTEWKECQEVLNELLRSKDYNK